MNSNTLDEMIALATATRWAWRNPYPDEDVPNIGSCLYPIALRNENVRAVCLAFEYQKDWKLLWSIWQAQQRDEGGEWRETFGFPRLEESARTRGAAGIGRTSAFERTPQNGVACTHHP